MSRPGRLDQRILIQRETLTDDGMGGDTLSWVNHVNTWAGVAPSSGRENEYGQQVQASNLVIFTIRYREDLLLTDRVVWNGDSYNILALPPPSTRKLYRTIEAERGIAQ